MFLTDADTGLIHTNNGSTIFEPSSWFTYDVIVNCLYQKREKVCISYELCALSAFLSVFACLLLIHQRCYLRKQITADAATCSVYCFLGNLCNSVGAFLSNQLAFQVFMGAFWAALDVVTCLGVLLPMYLWFRSETGKRTRIKKRRRRQNLLSVCLLLMVTGGGIHLTARSQVHFEDISTSRRRLLGTSVHDSLELLGYTLGLLSFAISWTSRFPAILKVYNRNRRGIVDAVAGILYALAGGLYTAAILVHDTRLAFVVKALPWLMSSTCWGVLELLILVFSLSRGRSATHHTVRSLRSDTVALLGATPVSGNHRRKGQGRHKDKEGALPFPPMINSTLPKRTNMGHYMDINSPPVRKACLKEVRISCEGQFENEPLKRTVKVVRVDEVYSSGNTSESSFSSDLEWDFEAAAAAQWCKDSKKQDGAEAFPLQQWTVKPSLKTSMRSGSHSCCCDQGLVTNMAADGPTDSEKTTLSSEK